METIRYADRPELWDDTETVTVVAEGHTAPCNWDCTVDA